MRGARTAVVKVGVVLAVAGASLTAHQGARARAFNLYSSKSTQIAPGVTYTKIVTGAPNHIYVLTIAPGAAATIDTVMAHAQMPGWQRTSVMVNNDGGIAGVNGDFGLWPGRPAHVFSMNGNLVQTNVLGGNSFAVSQDESHAYVNSPSTSVSVLEVAARKTWNVDQWNTGAPGPNTVGGYSAEGGSVSPPPKNACSVRLQPSGGMYWASSKSGVSRNYSVDTVVCQSSPLALNGGVVLAANSGSTKAQLIKAMTKGESVTLTWTLGWPDILDTVGGNPQLVSNGKIAVSPCGGYLCELQPRTAVGVTSTGKIILMVCDGREPGWSTGLTIVQTAKEMQNLGAVWAMNLDGGGSSTMVVNGKVQNRPSDGSERYVSNAIVLLPGADPNDPKMALGAASRLSALLPATVQSPTAPTPPLVAQQAWQAELTDPGSTGGLLAYLSQLGRPLTPQLSQDVRTFRAAQG